jgi:hypothetical protein
MESKGRTAWLLAAILLGAVRTVLVAAARKNQEAEVADDSARRLQ